MNNPLSPKSIVDFTNLNIPDPGLRHLIFGAEEIDFDDIKDNPIACIYRCVSVAWIFTFVAWKNEAFAGIEEKPKTNANALRIWRSFNSVYRTENISLDLMFFTLTEMQLDVINNRRSPYKDIIINNSQDLTINQLRQLVRVWKQSYKRAEPNLSSILNSYLFVVELLPVLKDLQVIRNNTEISFVYRGKKYDTFGIVKFDEEKSPYYYFLSEVSRRKNQYHLEYSDFIGSRIIEEDIPQEAFFQKFNLTIGGEQVSAILAQKLYSVDYKYIHFLALAVSDALDDSIKEKLVSGYARSHPDAFKLGAETNFAVIDSKGEVDGEILFKIIDDANWDNVIAFLMLETGPSTILEKVINRNYKIFEILAQNLEVRFSGKIKADSLIDEYNTKRKEEFVLIRKISGDLHSLDEVVEKAQGNLMVQTIIRAVTALVENTMGYSYTAAYVETLNMRIRNLENVMKGGLSNEEKTLVLNKALEKTLRFIIAFYHGLLAYANELNTAQNSTLQVGYSINELIDRCEAAFLSKASEKAQKCKRDSVGKLIDEFRTLSTKFSDNSGRQGRSVTKDGELLKSVIGRDYLCDLKTYDAVSKSVAGTINEVKHYTNQGLSISDILANENLDKAKELLYFFIYNKDFHTEWKTKHLISIDPIYPYVVRYCIKSENRDGYNINSYVVNMSNDDMDIEVNLLTEKNYEINELYYCIPNLKGTLPRWWIKPFLIKCRDIDQLFLE